jgi:DNA-binding GntR family transcriptional regulator
MLKTVELSNAPDQILRDLKGAIMQGRFAPGERITLNGLSAKFGTSHMPVREALRQLVAVGALRRERTRSLAIPPMSARDFRELLRVRMLLEGPAAELAAGHLSIDDIESLKHIDREMDAVLKARVKDRSKYLQLNHSFHFAVYRASNCQPLVRVIEGLWLQIGPYLTLVDIENYTEKPHALHADVIHALEDNDGPGAREAMTRELRDGGERLLAVMSKRSSSKREDDRSNTVNVRRRRSGTPLRGKARSRRKAATIQRA